MKQHTVQRGRIGAALPLLAGLICAQALATLFVRQSNELVLKQIQALTAVGWMAIPAVILYCPGARSVLKGILTSCPAGTPFHSAIIALPFLRVTDKDLCNISRGTFRRNSPFFSKE